MHKNRNLNALSKSGGKNSILVNTVNDYLFRHFSTYESYVRKYRELLHYDKESKTLRNHKIFAIMDYDNCDEKIFKSYIDKSLFKGFWWGDMSLIEPIYFIPNFDAVLSKHGFNIDTKKPKPFQYYKIFSLNYEEVIEILRNLPLSETNISVLFDFLDNIKN